MIKFITHKAVWPKNTYYHVMATVDGVGVGYGTLLIYDEDRSYCVLNSLNVSEEFQHLGIGLRLQEIREELGKELGCEDAYLWVEKWTWLRKWYKRRGYVYHAKYTEYDVKNNVWLLTIWERIPIIIIFKLISVVDPYPVYVCDLLISFLKTII